MTIFQELLIKTINKHPKKFLIQINLKQTTKLKQKPNNRSIRRCSSFPKTNGKEDPKHEETNRIRQEQTSTR